MKDSENLYDKIKELIGKDPGSFNIMEENIDVDLQLEYFEFSRRIASEYDTDWAMDQIDLLQDEDFPQEGKKQLLARLATMDEVAAYRAIESYAQNPDTDLKDWSLLALQESRMHIESDLLEENQVFISTGLGGKNNKLRYFVVLISRGRKELSLFQLKVIQDEFPYTIKKYNGEIEEFNSSGYLATFLLVLPINYSVQQIFSEAIDECNQFGEFLRDDCIVTNVKKLSFEEIENFIEKK